MLNWADMRMKTHSGKPLAFALSGFVLILICPVSDLSGQATSGPTPAVSPSSESSTPAVPIEISDDPKTIDPLTLVSPSLATAVTVKFDGEPLKKVLTWLQQDQKINLLVDYNALASAKVLDTEPVSDELNNAPLYLLLNRLGRMGILWYEQDDSVVITSRDEYFKHLKAVSYNLGEFFDAGYAPQDLLDTLKRCSGGHWGDSNGSALLLGDVVFIRQIDQTHREIAGLLAALRKPGRRTLTLDSPRNELLRAAMLKKITVDFNETPLVVAVQEISRLSQIDIRLDRAALARSNIRERIPVTLKRVDQKLNDVLLGLISNHGLNWYLRDEILWITSAEAVGWLQKSAVYDVRDLCGDPSESSALKSAIESQIQANATIQFPIPGVLVVRHSESILDEVLLLLENYRTALKASKVRVVATPPLDPDEVVTGYYRLSFMMGGDLFMELPGLILPHTWRSLEHPDAIGTIATITEESPALDAKGNPIKYRILVIRQTRAVHQKIGKLITTLIGSRTVDPEATIDTSKNSGVPSGTFGRRLMQQPKH